MTLERIRIRLSVFEKIKTLRDEEKARTEELDDVERTIREKLFLVEQQRYLESLSPFYASAMAGRSIPSMDEVDQLEARRGQLVTLLELIRAQIPDLLAQAEGKEPDGEPSQDAPSSASQARKVRFDSFEDFRRKQ